MKMKEEKLKNVVIGAFLALTIAFFIGGCEPTEEYQRVVLLSEALAAGSLFTAQTHNGAINLTGQDTPTCDLTVTITARADTVENAQELAEAVNVKLEPKAGGLAFIIEKPSPLINKYVGVAIDGTLPNRADLDLTTHNGAVDIINITGNTKALTHNGAITCQNTSGTNNLTTHNGKISCTEVTGDLRLRTHNGGIKAAYSTTATPPKSIDAVTHNGSIHLQSTAGFTGQVDISTHNGSISTNLPITISGEISKNHLQGKVGIGEGKLRLETHNGSIRID
jgi:hypothetical protein